MPHVLNYFISADGFSVLLPAFAGAHYPLFQPLIAITLLYSAQNYCDYGRRIVTNLLCTEDKCLASYVLVFHNDFTQGVKISFIINHLNGLVTSRVDQARNSVELNRHF